jgi:RND family efflux transporter MFP subunit
MTGCASRAKLPPGSGQAIARKGRYRWLAFAVLLMLGTVAGARAQPAPKVTASAPLQREITEWNEYTGQFAATESVEVRARVSGYLTEIHFQDGQFVKAGDLLFVIDPRPFEIAFASAEAQLTQATARLDLANRQLARAASLRQNDVVAASTYDERLAEVREATGALDAAHAQVDQAKLNLDYTRVTAPLAGHVSRHEVSIGNLVFGGTSANTTLLTTIVATDPIYCVFDISEADLLAYQHAAAESAGQHGDDPLTVEARLSDETGWKLKGQLNFVENQVNRSSGTLRVRAVFANPGAQILAGEFARVRIPASAPHQALLVPDAAVVSDQSRKLLMVVAADGTIVPKLVTLGPLVDGLRVIRSGIAPADRIVIDGLMRVRPGAKVTAEPGKIEPEPSQG